ncbi:hypothetical protein SCORR_v1c01560 [Spiroplasma corruscae]|uniref:J domain-containing protein n=1 Tax=Spiroplasma corruscae TaxID=216934 RepID=A0A222END0_9MOLU|nr:J domain-containing protein [Spiroplasma corruscae]ASP27931.1 hypothetical protein SCORR_v1c01560 [Spiroplasma corruscae]
MDDLFRIIGKILNFIFIILIFDWIFGGSRRANRRSAGSMGGDTGNDHKSYDDYSHTNKDTDSSSNYFNGFDKPSQLEEAYAVLGLSSSVSLKEVKKKYIELAKKYHPDKNKGNLEAQAKMTQINNAYDTILQHKQS